MRRIITEQRELFIRQVLDIRGQSSEIALHEAAADLLPEVARLLL
jgi:hypothetical protein